jgi:hypothetical protein
MAENNIGVTCEITTNSGVDQCLLNITITEIPSTDSKGNGNWCGGKLRLCVDSYRGESESEVRTMGSSGIAQGFCFSIGSRHDLANLDKDTLEVSVTILLVNVVARYFDDKKPLLTKKNHICQAEAFLLESPADFSIVVNQHTFNTHK